MAEERDGAAVRIPPPLVFLAGVALGWLLERFVWSLPLPLGGAERTVVAVVIGVMAFVIIGAALGMFRATGQAPQPWKPTPAIVTTGIYGYTRNPMYVGMALLQITIGVALSSGWTLILVAPALALVSMIAIRHEEAYLERKFGEPYLEYMRKVRRWI